MSEGYRILDEPEESPLSNVAVNPVWPLLGVMLGGAWLAWPWFVVNALAVGSPTRKREIALALGGFVGSVVLFFALAWAAQQGVVTGVGIRYALVGLVVWKLYVSYRLFLLQARTFELYRYFGGTVRNGLLPVLAAFYLEPRLLGGLPAAAQYILG